MNLMFPTFNCTLFLTALPYVLLQVEQQLAFVLVVCIVARDENAKPRGMIDLLARSATE